eukprot:896789-Pyramimonas_sp.AAC.1
MAFPFEGKAAESNSTTPPGRLTRCRPSGPSGDVELNAAQFPSCPVKLTTGASCVLHEVARLPLPA